MKSSLDKVSVKEPSPASTRFSIARIVFLSFFFLLGIVFAEAVLVPFIFSR